MVTSDKLEICPVWGKLEINFPVRTKETEAIMVLLHLFQWINMVFWKMKKKMQIRTLKMCISSYIFFKSAFFDYLNLQGSFNEK